MHRVDASGHVANQYSDGNPGLGIAATVVGATHLNAFQEEIAAAIEASGLALNKPDNTQLKAALSILFGARSTPGGRLTLSAGIGVPAADVTGANTVRYTPYDGDHIRLYDGTNWKGYTFTELAQLTTDATKSPAAVANNSNYDVFVWDDNGTLRATRGPAWTGDTNRGAGAGTTELELFQGRYVNKVAITNGPAARRGLYVGSIRSDGSALINDTEKKRHVWNNYNRVRRGMRVTDGAPGTYAYTTAALRQVHADATNQLDFLLGLSEDPVTAEAVAVASNTNTGVLIAVAIGLDGVNDSSTMATPGMTAIADKFTVARATHEASGYAVGRHYLTWCEWSEAVGTTTWKTNTQIGVVPSFQASLMA